MIKTFFINGFYHFMDVFSSCAPRQKKKAEARADSSPAPSSARASPSLRLISSQKISGGVRIAFSLHFPFWKALCFAQRRVARGETLVLHFFLEIGSCECYNDTTQRNISEIRNAERFCGSQNRAINFFKTISAYGGSGEFPKFPPIENMKDLKPKYFLYARKSTEDDDHQIMSIEAQLFELHEYARRENLEILQEFQESKSAKKPGRELFNEMMSRIDEMDGVGILAWHPDRLARNSVDGGRIIYLVDTEQNVSLRFPTIL